MTPLLLMAAAPRLVRARLDVSALLLLLTPSPAGYGMDLGACALLPTSTLNSATRCCALVMLAGWSTAAGTHLT